MKLSIPSLDQLERPEIELPPEAPVLRITAGVGSASQKTWSVRRPVTLVGSCRPAHIVLHDRDISRAHCVIVNTGTEVLLKDLHTSSGTFRNQERVDLIALKDGDVVTVGTTKIQIAIRVTEKEKEDSGCGLMYVEPTKFPKPLTVHLDHGDASWHVEDAVALVGRHSQAALRLDHADISTRHALIFRFQDGPAIFDLGSRTGVGVNGTPCTIAALRPGDRVGIGPCTLAFGAVDPLGIDWGDSDLKPSDHGPPIADEPQVTDLPHSSFRSSNGQEGAQAKTVSPPVLGSGADRGAPSGHTLAQIESELSGLQRNIADSWDRLNAWQERLRADAHKLSKQDSNLAARETEVDAKDAALRGQLHDLTRYHEQITERERELAAQLAHIQADRDQVNGAQADLVKREGEVARRNDEVQRREHVLAQRWARLLAATCPHCGKPVRLNGNETTP